MEVREILDPHVINALQAIGLAVIATAVCLGLVAASKPPKRRGPPNPRSKD